MRSIIQIARLFLYLREAGQNHGLRVNGIQIWAGGQDGDSYCCELAWVWLDLFFQGAAPIPRMQSCETFQQYATVHGWVVDTPQPGDFVLSMNTGGRAHHIALLTAVAPLVAIAGNTSADGTSSNGDGCYEHGISATQKVYVRIPGVVA